MPEVFQVLIVTTIHLCGEVFVNYWNWTRLFMSLPGDGDEEVRSIWRMHWALNTILLDLEYERSERVRYRTRLRRDGVTAQIIILTVSVPPATSTR